MSSFGLNDQLSELTKPVKIGETYNAESVNQVSSAIKDKLSVLGYASRQRTRIR